MINLTNFNTLGFGSTIEAFAQRPASTSSEATTTTATNPQTKTIPQQEFDTLEIFGKIEDFKTRLNDSNWKITYNKKEETVVLSSNDKKIDTEYIIDKNGTVSEIKKDAEPVVILKNSSEMAKIVQNKGLNPNAPKESFIKRTFGGVWKFFSAFGAMAGATVKGLFYGATTAATVLTGAWFVNVLPKVFKAEGPKFIEAVKHPLKNMGKTGKIIAGVSALGVLAYHLITGKFKANQNTAVIDHKLNIGHREG